MFFCTRAEAHVTTILIKLLWGPDFRPIVLYRLLEKAHVGV